MDLIYICFLRREVDVLANFVADITKKLVVDKILNYGVLVAVMNNQA